MERENEIRMIAYGLWAQEGFNHWEAIEHWLRAEKIWERLQKDLGTPLTPADEVEEEREKAAVASAA